MFLKGESCFSVNPESWIPAQCHLIKNLSPWMSSRQLSTDTCNTGLSVCPLDPARPTVPPSQLGSPIFPVSPAQSLAVVLDPVSLSPHIPSINTFSWLYLYYIPGIHTPSHHILCRHCDQAAVGHLDSGSGLLTGHPHPHSSFTTPSRQLSRVMTSLCSVPSQGRHFLSKFKEKFS